MVPVRADCGPDKGQLEWRRPELGDGAEHAEPPDVRRGLRLRPQLPGAGHGRGGAGRSGCRRTSGWSCCATATRPTSPGSGTRRTSPGWPRTGPCQEARGPVRRGRALLAGLVVCGRCGARMMTRYAGKASQPRYICDAARANYGAPPCQGLAARALDDEVVRLALRALTPAALEVSLRVAADLQGQSTWPRASGGSGWSGPGSRPSGRGGSTTPWSRRTGWWPARWSGLGAEAAGPPRAGRGARAVPAAAAARAGRRRAGADPPPGGRPAGPVGRAEHDRRRPEGGPAAGDRGGGRDRRGRDRVVRGADPLGRRAARPRPGCAARWRGSSSSASRRGPAAARRWS